MGNDQLARFTESLGLVRLRGAKNVAGEDLDPPGRIRLAVPRFQCSVELDAQLENLERTNTVFAAETILKVLEGARRELFGRTIAHVAKYDRSPLDRTEQIEHLAQQLINALQAVGMVPMAVANAAATLQQLIRHKPGAASWARNGYGEDPT